MKTFSLIILVWGALVFSVPAEPYRIKSKPNTVTKKELLAQSKALAAHMGETFQLAQNCGQSMMHISAPNANALFRNYFDQSKVDIIMKQYRQLVTKQQGRLCNRNKINFHRLMNKMATYMRTASSSLNNP